MLAPVDLDRLQDALATPRGRIELAIAALCLLAAWLIDRRIERARAARGDVSQIAASVVRVAFPLIALALIYVASVLWRHHVAPPFFLAIAAPLMVALIAIRTLVYGLRRLFPVQRWLPTSELAITSVVLGLLVLYFFGVLPEIAATLDEVVVPIGKTQISVLTVLTGIVVIVVTLIVALWVSSFLERRLMGATQLDANLRMVLAKTVRALVIVLAGLIALQQIGFDLTLLSVFGGALGVGIGLGLQKLASNYIAGFTILLDRSIRMGDLITLEGRTGTVVKVTSRYAVVRSLDGVEAIVPNETLVTTTVLNQSYTSREVRVALQVQISYDSDVETALALMEGIAKRSPRALGGERAPGAFLVAFADNGILLELGLWIGDPENGQLNLKSDLNRAILTEFQAHGIRFPFPQREIRILGGGPAEAAVGATGGSGGAGAADAARTAGS
ncbi:MAG: mechanosensitive ion channel family protein [Candidatus Levyibacteriota bacterium]